MVKHRKNVKFINCQEMNKLLEYVKKWYFPIYRAKADTEPFKYYAFIEDKIVSFRVSLNIGGKKCTYEARKDREEVVQCIQGVEAYKIVCQYYKIPEVSKPDDLGSAVPLLYFNQKYNCTRQKAWSYDLNSAYSDAMTGPMPDTSKVVGRYRNVEYGEIGFISYDSSSEIQPLPKNDLVMVDPGGYADIIFKAIESPFKRFVSVWYNRKNNAKNKIEKLKAKSVLNYCVGYFQKKNPYFRATIVTRCNNRIRRLIDSNTLYCNTDSLVSRVPRKELTIGTHLGEWKLEHVGQFAYKDFNYQWDDEIPTYRGKCKSWFKKGWDLLKDPLPETGNIYYFDKESLQLRRIDYEEQEKEN